jgi:acylphosphatase
MNSAPTRRSVYYSGRVQGVGFRYTARQIAERYCVTGFVRNLPDRRVELVVEGADDEISRFLGEIADRMIDNIRDSQISQSAATGQFTSFDISH